MGHATLAACIDHPQHLDVGSGLALLGCGDGDVELHNGMVVAPMNNDPKHVMLMVHSEPEGGTDHEPYSPFCASATPPSTAVIASVTKSLRSISEISHEGTV